MRGEIAIVFLMCGLLLFGCADGGAGEPGAGAGEPGAGPGTGTGEGAGEPGAGPGEPGAGPGEPAAGTDLSGMGWAALMALGTPLECDITGMSQGQMITYKVYMKGENEMRIEYAPLEESTCTEFITIMKGNTLYAGCGAGEEMFEGSGCQWLEMGLEPSETQGDTTTSEQPDFSDVPSSQINCRLWGYDASKFTPTGKTCTLEEMMQAYQ